MAAEASACCFHALGHYRGITKHRKIICNSGGVEETGNQCPAPSPSIK